MENLKDLVLQQPELTEALRGTVAEESLERGLGSWREIIQTQLPEIKQVLRASVRNSARLEQTLESMASGTRDYGEELQKSIVLIPGLTAKPWHDPASYPWTRSIEDSFSVIEDELEKASDSTFIDFVYTHLYTGSWKECSLFDQQGEPVAEYVKYFPRTIELIRAHHDQLEFHGITGFSMLAPGTHLRPHCGPSNVRIRCALGIKGLEGTSIRVANETREWVRGRFVVFDDSFEHEVWHRGEQHRVVLLLNAWHPDLEADERAFIAQFMGMLEVND